jgi:hypothetical protein
MIDLDLVSHLDVRTSLPAIDTRTTATRWLECLHHGPTYHGTPNVVPYFLQHFRRGQRRTTNQTNNARD